MDCMIKATPTQVLLQLVGCEVYDSCLRVKGGSTKIMYQLYHRHHLKELYVFLERFPFVHHALHLLLFAPRKRKISFFFKYSTHLPSITTPCLTIPPPQYFCIPSFLQSSTSPPLVSPSTFPSLQPPGAFFVVVVFYLVTKDKRMALKYPFFRVPLECITGRTYHVLAGVSAIF